jgi:hypothetical protein
MYHDEFARKPSNPGPVGENAMPSLPLEVGGGLSIGLAMSLNQPISMLLLYLGGLLPLVTCSLTIAAHRVAEVLAALAPRLETRRRAAVPAPHLAVATIPMAVARFRRQRVRSGR